jgi:hypothetical protein
VLIGLEDQFIDSGPAFRVKRQADLAWLVSQYDAQKFAGLH